MFSEARTYIHPYNNYSKSAKELAKALGIKRIHADMDASNFADSSVNKIIINWGRVYGYKNAIIINNYKIVEVCSNKLNFFNKMFNGPRIPEYTESLDKVKEWIGNGKLVLSRKKRGTNGQDIMFSNEDMNNFFEGEFYTLYVKKKEEYRVHIAFDNVICIQQKVLRKEDDAGNPIDKNLVDFRIRNHKNGFIFIKNNLHTPQDVIDQAKSAYKMSGLDFGAFDVIYNEHEDKAYVLEVNTAPGLEGTTVDAYANAFRENL